ncbi:MAG: hypothetical protein Q4E13_09015, partial [Clostridia bacterium]|nr:hypothetical protein [Clostridia bacterium]
MKLISARRSGMDIVLSSFIDWFDYTTCGCILQAARASFAIELRAAFIHRAGGGATGRGRGHDHHQGARRAIWKNRNQQRQPFSSQPMDTPQPFSSQPMGAPQ